MSGNGRPSIAKRQKELARQEKQREKISKRAQKAVEKANRPPGWVPDDTEINADIAAGPDGGAASDESA